MPYDLRALHFGQPVAFRQYRKQHSLGHAMANGVDVDAMDCEDLLATALHFYVPDDVCQFLKPQSFVQAISTGDLVTAIPCLPFLEEYEEHLDYIWAEPVPVSVYICHGMRNTTAIRRRLRMRGFGEEEIGVGRETVQAVLGLKGVGQPLAVTPDATSQGPTCLAHTHSSIAKAQALPIVKRLQHGRLKWRSMGSIPTHWRNTNGTVSVGW